MFRRRKMPTKLPTILSSLLAGLMLTGCYQLANPDLEVYRDHFYPVPKHATPLKPGKRVDVTFLGTTSLYFNDGETHILIDGFFTRPTSVMQVFFGQIETDKAKVKDYLDRLKIKHLDALPVFHSHYDHAMDTAEIARLTGGTILGSESTALIAQGAGLPARQMIVVEPGKAYRFGKFKITMIVSKHIQMPGPIEATGMMGKIEAPLHQPASIYDYREGTTYAILIEHPLGTSLLHSGAFVPGELKGRHADTLFMCTPGVPGMPEAEREQFYREIIAEPGVSRVVPVHWDDFTHSLDEPLIPLPRFAEDFDAAMGWLLDHAKRKPGFKVQILPAWETVPLFKK